MKIKTLTTNGTSVDIYVNSEGEFTATAAGKHLRAPMLTTLTSQVQRLMRVPKVKIELPYTLLSGPNAIDVVVTGIHAGTGKALGYYVKNPRAKLDTNWNNTMVRRLTADEAAEYVRLYAAERAAETARRVFVDRHKAPNYLEEVAAAIEAAREAEDGGPEDTGDPR